MTAKTPTTAAEKDALISRAAAFSIQITRTSKDFFLHDGDDKARVTPGQIISLVEDAEREAQEKEEAFEAAEAIRAEVEMGEGDSLEDKLDVALGSAPAAKTAAVTTPVDTAEPQAARAVAKYGPPCGGKIDHLSILTLPEAANPLFHMDFEPFVVFDSKEAARDYGRGLAADGFLAFMATYEGRRFWAVASVAADGTVMVSGRVVTLSLLTGEEAAAARAKVQGARWQSKHQFQAVAV